MSVTIFLGDSHSHGWYDKDNRTYSWQDNNYAEIFANKNKMPVVIYSMPAASNKKFPIWLKVLFDRYTDIKQVFVQSTYWHRWMLGEVLDNERVECEIDNFTQCISNDNLIHRYTDIEKSNGLKEVGIQIPLKISKKLFSSKIDPDHSPYFVVKAIHELCTHLQYREYCMDLFVIDSICKQRNVPCTVWRINDKCLLPKNLNLFGELSIKFAPLSADMYFKQKNIIMNDFKLDEEHYNKEMHEMIAADYIQWLINLSS